MGALQAIVLLLAGGLLGFTWGSRGRGPGPAPMSVRHVPHRRRRWTRSVVRLARMQAADLDAALMQLSQTAAHAVGVDRASVWQVQPDQQTIICKEMYFRDSGRHVAGIVVPLAHVSRYLAALDADRTLAIADVAHDERCRELQDAYLAPHAIRSMLDVPIRFRGRLVGILCHESTRATRSWTADEREMAATLGDLAALTWEGFAHTQAEAELRERHGQLQVAKDRMDAALAAMAEGMLITDAEDRILRCNAAAATLLGRPCRELPGTPITAVIALPPGRTALRDVLITLDRPVGAIRQLRANRSPVSGTGCVITLRDVTAEEEVNRLKTDFVAIASHELRTPLTIIQGYVGLLLMGEERGMAPARRQELLTSLRLHCDRLGRLIRDVLNVARLDADALPAQPESVDVTRVIAETLDLLGPQAHRKGIRLLARYGTQPLPAVWADSGHLLQILTNLVENAIKYSPPDRQVLIEAQPTASMLRISVSDQGIGIPATEQAQIFSRFHRVATPTMLKERGSGLGLYIARRLAEAQGGTLLVSSLPGTGSTFAVTLPLARALNPPAEQVG
jgi:signal transduction histidine kinase